MAHDRKCATALPWNRIESNARILDIFKATRRAVIRFVYALFRKLDPVLRSCHGPSLSLYKVIFATVSPFTSGYICRLKNVQGGSAAAMDRARRNTQKCTQMYPSPPLAVPYRR